MLIFQYSYTAHLHSTSPYHPASQSHFDTVISLLTPDEFLPDRAFIF